MFGDASELLVVLELVSGNLAELLIEPLLFILKLEIGHLYFFLSLELPLQKQVQELRILGNGALELCLGLQRSHLLSVRR